MGFLSNKIWVRIFLGHPCILEKRRWDEITFLFVLRSETLVKIHDTIILQYYEKIPNGKEFAALWNIH